MSVRIDLHERTRVLGRSLSRAPKSTVSRVEPGSRVRRVLPLLRAREEGGALVEIALTLPMLLALLTAICAFGIGFNNDLTLTSAVGAGAQELQLIRTTTSDPCADTLAAIEGAAPSLHGASINLTLTMNTTTVTGPTCSGYQSNQAPGTPVTVSATYPCALPIYGTTFSNACQLSAKVTEFEY